MKNLRLLSLVGLFVIFCTENVNSNVSSVERIANTALTVPSGQRYNAIDALLSSLVPSSSTSNQQSQITKKDLINQQDVNGQTPLHIVLSRQGVQVDHVTPLLDLGADILVGNAAPKVRTSLHVAAGLNDPSIFQLFIKKILLDSLTAAIAEAGVPLLSLPPYNLAAPPNINVLQHNDTNLKDALKTVLECYDFSNSSILQANLNGLHFGLKGVVPEHTPAPTMESIWDFISVLKAYIVAPDRPAIESIEYFINVLQAYIHVNNLSIDSKTLGNFNIHFRALNGKNLLQLAGDRRNTRLVHCICSRIYTPFYTPWALYYLSRASDTNWISPMYDNLRCNDEIRQTIRTRYWSQFLGYDALRLVITGTIGACLGGLILQRLYPN